MSSFEMGLIVGICFAKLIKWMIRRIPKSEFYPDELIESRWKHWEKNHG